MRPAKKHRITAVFLDIFIIGSIVQVFGTIFISLMFPDAAAMMSLPIGVLYIVAVIVYHAAIARRVRFCSPGESIAGCRVGTDGKSWFTIYTTSRWFLFLTLFLLLYNPANAFDGMQRANEYPLPMVIGKSIYVFLMLWFIYHIGIGRFLWSIAMFVMLAMHVLASIQYLNVQPDLARIGLGVFGLQTVFLAVVLVVYKNRSEVIEETEQQQILDTTPTIP